MNCYKLYKTDFRNFYIFSKINQWKYTKKNEKRVEEYEKTRWMCFFDFTRVFSNSGTEKDL